MFRLKIGFVIYGDMNQVSGGYMYDRKLKEYLERKGDEVEVISLEDKGYLENIEDNFSEELFDRLNDLDIDLLLEDELNHPSLFHMNERLSGYPIVSVVHHLSYLASKGEKSRMFKYFEEEYLGSVDGFIFSSDETRESVEDLIGETEGVVAVPGCDHIDVEEYELDESHISRSDSLDVLFVGNVAEHKGLDNLLDALSMTDGARLRIIGRLDLEPEYSERLLDRVVNYPNVDVLGYVKDSVLREELKKSDLLVLPSLYEGFGLVILEAFAFGKPVVSTCRGGPCSIVRDGENGFLVDPEDEEEISEKLTYFIDNPGELNRMGMNARKCYDDSRCWDESMKDVWEFIHSYE